MKTIQNSKFNWKLCYSFSLPIYILFRRIHSQVFFRLIARNCLIFQLIIGKFLFCSRNASEREKTVKLEKLKWILYTERSKEKCIESANVCMCVNLFLRMQMKIELQWKEKTVSNVSGNGPSEYRMKLKHICEAKKAKCRENNRIWLMTTE